MDGIHRMGGMGRWIPRTSRALARAAVRGGEEADVSLRIASKSSAGMPLLRNDATSAVQNAAMQSREGRVRMECRERTRVLLGHFSQTV